VNQSHPVERRIHPDTGRSDAMPKSSPETARAAWRTFRQAKSVAAIERPVWRTARSDGCNGSSAPTGR
jgi:hypothetical protein